MDAYTANFEHADHENEDVMRLVNFLDMERKSAHAEYQAIQDDLEDQRDQVRLMKDHIQALEEKIAQDDARAQRKLNHISNLSQMIDSYRPQFKMDDEDYSD